MLEKGLGKKQVLKVVKKDRFRNISWNGGGESASAGQTGTGGDEDRR